MATLGSPQNYLQCSPHPPLLWCCRGRMLPVTRMSRGRACIGSIVCPVDTTGDIRGKTLLVYADTPPGPRYPSSLSPHPKASTRLVYVQRDGGIRVVSGCGLLAKANYARAPNQRGEPTLRSRRLCSHRHSFTISSGSVLCNVKTGWHQWPSE